MNRLERPSIFSCPHCGKSLCFSEKAGQFFQVGAIMSFLVSPAIAFFYSVSTAMFSMALGFFILAYGLLSQRLVFAKPIDDEIENVANEKVIYSMSIAINHDDYHAKHVGRTKDRLQFFLTEPFYFDSKNSSVSEYVALYLFHSSGELFDRNIVYVGQRGEFSQDHRSKIYNDLLNSLVDVEFMRIEVKPFTVKKYGIEFGLIPREPDEEEDILSVELLPGNYMAFFEPWDSGIYDT